MKLPDSELNFLVQFVQNAEEAGVLWRVGKTSDGKYVVDALVGTHPCKGSQPHLSAAIKECLEKATRIGVALGGKG